MKIVEVPMNLITMPQGWYLAYAVSADLNFTVGLPKLFNDTFQLEYKIDDPKVGDAIVVGNTVSLIVKDGVYDKVDISDLCCALQNLRTQCEEVGITRLAMPKICCGNNGMKWKEVKSAIRGIFKGSNVFIMICV